MSFYCPPIPVLVGCSPGAGGFAYRWRRTIRPSRGEGGDVPPLPLGATRPTAAEDGLSQSPSFLLFEFDFAPRLPRAAAATSSSVAAASRFLAAAKVNRAMQFGAARRIEKVPNRQGSLLPDSEAPARRGKSKRHGRHLAAMELAVTRSSTNARPTDASWARAGNATARAATVTRTVHAGQTSTA